MNASTMRSRSLLRANTVALLCASPPAVTWAGAVIPPPTLLPLNQVAVPEPLNLFQFVKNKPAAIKLGKALFWDKEARKPVDADASWAAAWEKRSKERGSPNHVMDWTGGDKGSKLIPPEYMKLAGPWVDGKDPGEV